LTPPSLPTARPLRAGALLFDLDGTLIDSSAIYDWAWTEWSQEAGLDPAKALAIHHGRRIPETIALIAPAGYDVLAGSARVLELASSRVDGLREIPGATALLQSLPRERWAIVTSSYPDLVRRWLRRLAMPEPVVLVTALDVERGKPAPDCYRLAAKRLNRNVGDCVVFEDAPAGIAAGEAAGCQVIAVATMLGDEALAGRDWVRDLRNVRIEIDAQSELRLSF